MRECEACGRCLNDATERCPVDGSPTNATLPGDPKVDRYLLERRIGQGGMGIVYKAQHEYLRTTHALKVILPGFLALDPKLAARFRQEALALAAVKHPNVVSITDSGVAGAMPFLVMEFLEGKSLAELLADGRRLTTARALEVLKPAGEGVAAAHRLGIIHRDLKPLNIFIQESGKVKVLDFGLAKVLSPGLLGSLKLDKSSGIVGTPYYLAPEQCQHEEPDERTDVYALGVILYQMLAGRPPFIGRNEGEVMRHLLESDPPPLGSFDVRVPPRFEAAVLRALAKDRAQRPPSVEAFLDELSAAQDSGREQEGLNPSPEPNPPLPDAHFAATLHYSTPELPPPNAAPPKAEDAAPSKARPQAALVRLLSSFARPLFSSLSRLHPLAAFGGAVILLVAFAIFQSILRGTSNKGVIVPPPPVQPIVLSPERDFSGHTSAVEAIAFSRRDDELAVACLGGEVSLWDVATGARRSPFYAVPAVIPGMLASAAPLVHAIAFMPGDRLAVAAGKNIVIWDAGANREIARLPAHPDQVFALAVSPDGKLLASGSRDGEIQFWEAETWKSLHTIATAQFIKGLDFSPDSRTLASAAYDGFITLWESDTGAMKSQLHGPGGRLFAVAFSPDGKMVAGGGENGLIILWDLTFTNSSRTLKGHGGAVNSLAFSPGGRALASGSDDKTAVVWDVSKGAALQPPLTRHRAEVTAVAFSHDGKLLATGSSDRTVTLWEAHAATPAR